MTKKILFVATVWNFFNFLRRDIKMLTDEGWEVHCATNFEYYKKPIEIENLVVKHQIDFARTPLNMTNVSAVRQLAELMTQEHFDIVHCHTSVGALAARLTADKYRRTGTKVIYTAHGLYFYKGAPIKDWLLYYPVEWLLSWKTDVQITINREDYETASKHFHAGETVYVPGVGIDTARFRPGTADVQAKRTELGVGDDEIMLLSVGELCARKNHALVIRTLKELGDDRIKYFIAGNGGMREQLEALIKELGMEERVFLLGPRGDVPELCRAADLYVFPSHQEGLPVALMEAIACERPVICSKIRGNVDLITDGDWMFDQHSTDSLKECLQRVLGARTRSEFAAFAAETVRENRERLRPFQSDAVAERMREIYGLQ